MPGRYDKGSPPTDGDFTGHVKDEATGLHYAGARYYSAAFGRWLKPDPILGEKGPKKLLKQDARLLTMTSYNYAFDNPALLRDPNGKTPCGGVCTGAAIAGGTGFVFGAGIEAVTQGWQKGTVDPTKLDGSKILTSGSKGATTALGGFFGGPGGAAAGAGISEGVEGLAKNWLGGGESLSKTMTDITVSSAAAGLAGLLGRTTNSISKNVRSILRNAKKESKGAYSMIKNSLMESGTGEPASQLTKVVVPGIMKGAGPDVTGRFDKMYDKGQEVNMDKEEDK